MRFPLFTDNHVRDPILAGLRRLGWTVIRAIDTFPEKTPDEILFEYAARHGHVFVTNESDPALPPFFRSEATAPSTLRDSFRKLEAEMTAFVRNAKLAA